MKTDLQQAKEQIERRVGEEGPVNVSAVRDVVHGVHCRRVSDPDIRQADFIFLASRF